MKAKEDQLLLGLEEEVFITEPILPSLGSLWYLARLLWSNPAYYYAHSASNFARGRDVRQAIMSGVEVSTGIHSNPDDLVRDLAVRRQELARAARGLIVSTGHLFDLDAPTNTCGLHVHVGPVPGEGLERVYCNLAHFLPLLALLTASSPVRKGQYFGQSYRMARSYAIGPLRKGDKKYRFQDMIVSKRLGTIELRIFDPVWDLERIRVLLACVQALATSGRRFSWDEPTYAAERQTALTYGYTGSLPGRYVELSEVCDVSEDSFAHTASDMLYRCWQDHGALGTYVALDNAYRRGVFDPATAIPAEQGWEAGITRICRAALGFTCYYVPKLPYIIMKGLKEQ